MISPLEGFQIKKNNEVIARTIRPMAHKSGNRHNLSNGSTRKGGLDS